MTLYLAVGIQLILLVGSGSFASEAGSSYDSKDQKTLPQYDRYIMKPYFEKYDSLHDSHYQNFIKHELSFGSCEVPPGISNLLPQLSVSNRYLIGEGSHRRLSSTIRLEKQSEFVSQLPKLFCEVIIVEKLPSGVFADPFELEHLLQRGVFSDAVVFGDTNLELPSVLSNRSLVEIHVDIGSSILSRLSNGPDINIELPLHARYPPLEESGYSRVEFGVPDLFMHCSSKGRPLIQSCLLMMKDDDDDAESRTRSVVWSLPSGIEAHARVVSVVTFVLATLSTLLIVLSSMYYSGIMSYTNLKQC